MKKFLVIICCLLLILCSACGKGTIQIEDAQQLILEEVDLLIKTSDEDKNLLSIIKSNLDITVVDIEETKEGTFAVCDVSNYDANKILTDYMKANSSRELTNDEFMAEIESEFESSEKSTTQIKVVVNFEDNKVTGVSFTEEQLDILLGGYMSFSNSFVDSLAE